MYPGDTVYITINGKSIKSVLYRHCGAHNGRLVAAVLERVQYSECSWQHQPAAEGAGKGIEEERRERRGFIWRDEGGKGIEGERVER